MHAAHELNGPTFAHTIVTTQELLAALPTALSDSYNHPPRTFEDLYKLTREEHIDPLKEFTEACREERKATLMHL